MLDLGWSELLVVAVVALIVVGPKELPALLRTIGKFVNVIRRQAGEFRAQFDDAIKDTEFEQVRKDFQDLKSDAEATVRDAGRGIEDEMRELDDVSRDIDRELMAGIEGAESPPPAAVSDSSDNDEDLDWMETYNKTVLEAEQQSHANGSSTLVDGDDAGAPDETKEAEVRDTDAAGTAGEDAVIPEKAGAAT